MGENMNKQDYLGKIKGCRSQIEKCREDMEWNNSTIANLEALYSQVNARREFAENHFTRKIQDYQKLCGAYSKRIMALASELSSSAINNGDNSMAAYREIQNRIECKIEEQRERNQKLSVEIGVCEDKIAYYKRKMELLE